MLSPGDSSCGFPGIYPYDSHPLRCTAKQSLAVLGQEWLLGIPYVVRVFMNNQHARKLEIPQILQLICGRDLTMMFSNLATILKMYTALPKAKCEARRFSNLDQI